MMSFHLTGAALSGTGQLLVVDSLVLGFRFWIEKLIFVTQDTLVGAGGVQTFNLRKGGVAGTVIATVAPTIAANAVMGTVLADSLVAGTEDGAGRFLDADALTIERAAGGTAFSAGSAELYVLLREKAQGR